MMKLDIQYYLGVKNIILFKTELDILWEYKSGIAKVISHNYANTKVNSYYSLPPEKKQWLLIMLYLLSQCLTKIKTTTIIIYSQKKPHMNYPENQMSPSDTMIYLMMSMNLSHIANLNIKNANYRCIISRISKKSGNKLKAKYRFDRKKRNIIKHKI